MKRLLQYLLILLGVGAAAGLVANSKINALKDTVEQLGYQVSNVQFHKLNLQRNEIEVKLHVDFTNPTDTTLTASNILVRLHIPDGRGGWLQLATSGPLGKTSVVPGFTKIPLKFTAPIASEFISIIPRLFQGQSQKLMVEIFPQILGHNLKPVTAEIEVNAANELNNLISSFGLGLVSNDKQAKKDGSDLEHAFPTDAVIGDSIVVANGSVYRTLQEMEKVVKATLPQTKKLAKELKRSNLQDTLKSVFDFANDYFAYKMDDAGVEQIRTPARAIKDRFIGIDCDCFTVLISSILYNLNIRHKYRMTKYKRGSNYQHVYVVVPHQNWRA